MAKVVNRLASIKDSTKSKFRIGKLKMEAIEDLQKSIETCQSKRADVIRAIRKGRSGIPKEVLEGEADHYDENIEKHIEQILEISKSFTQDTNVQKYRQIGGGGYGWGWGDLYEISDEWYQNRRDRTMNKKQRGEVIDALKKSIRRCEILIAGLRDHLENNKITASDRELMRSELNRHIRMKDKRQGQLEELIVVPTPATVPLSRDAAMDLEEFLEDQIADMQRDLETIFFKHAQLNRERPKFYKLRANLEARKKWLAEHEKRALEELKEKIK